MFIYPKKKKASEDLVEYEIVAKLSVQDTVVQFQF